MGKLTKNRTRTKKKKEKLSYKRGYDSIKKIRVRRRRNTLIIGKKAKKKRVVFKLGRKKKKKKKKKVKKEDEPVNTFIEMSNLFKDNDFPLELDWKRIPNNARIRVNKAKTWVIWENKKYPLIMKNKNTFECLGMNFTLDENNNEEVFNEFKNIVFYLNKNDSYDIRKKEYIKNGIENEMEFMHDGPIMIEVVVRRGSRKMVRNRKVIKKSEEFSISKNNKHLYFYEKNKILRYDIVGGPAQYWSRI